MAPFDVRERCKFVPELEVEHIVRKIKEYFAENGPEANAVIGISGGKDSTVAAMLCTKALGSQRVIGVMIPDGPQKDIGDSEKVIQALHLPYYNINIEYVTDNMYEAFEDAGIDCIRDEASVYTNTPPRIRMAVLYNIAALMHGRVINTCNLSERYIGWETKFGDSAGDFSLFQNYTATEVIQLGMELIKDFPKMDATLISKTPDDGLCGLSDEEKFGFSYAMLDDYIRNTKADLPANVVEKIHKMHTGTRHKRAAMPFVSTYGGMRERF